MAEGDGNVTSTDGRRQSKQRRMTCVAWSREREREEKTKRSDHRMLKLEQSIVSRGAGKMEWRKERRRRYTKRELHALVWRQSDAHSRLIVFSTAHGLLDMVSDAVELPSAVHVDVCSFAPFRLHPHPPRQRVYSKKRIGIHRADAAYAIECDSWMTAIKSSQCLWIWIRSTCESIIIIRIMTRVYGLCVCVMNHAHSNKLLAILWQLLCLGKDERANDIHHSTINYGFTLNCRQFRFAAAVAAETKRIYSIWLFR